MESSDFRATILNRLYKRDQTYSQANVLVQKISALSIIYHAKRREHATLQLINDGMERYIQNRDNTLLPCQPSTSLEHRNTFLDDLALKFDSCNKLMDLIGQLQASQSRLVDMDNKLEVLRSDMLRLRTENLELPTQKTNLQIAKGEIIRKNTLISNIETKIVNVERKCSLQESENQFLRDRINVLKADHEALQANQREADAMNTKLHAENRLLLAQVLQKKDQLINQMNLEVEKFTPLRDSYIRIISVSATEMTRSPHASLEWEDYLPDYCIVPTQVSCQFEAHDDEICSCAWAHHSDMFATGDGTRVIKIWRLYDNRTYLLNTFNESLKGITTVAFSSDNTSLLAACNDHYARLWTVRSGTRRAILAGHVDKLTAARFKGNAQDFALTASEDSTWKLWDLNTTLVIRSVSARSRCVDLATCTYFCHYTGHFDKSVRCWDDRVPSEIFKTYLEDKLTSLSLASNLLLVSCRDNTIKIFDCRQLKEGHPLACLEARNFQVEGFTRAAFSSDGQYVACGSQDGSVFVWSCDRFKLEPLLPNAHKTSVVACSWSNAGLLSVDRRKTCVIWK